MDRLIQATPGAKLTVLAHVYGLGRESVADFIDVDSVRYFRLYVYICFRLAKLEVSETYENSRHFDLTFMVCVWLAFMPTVTTPLLFVAWNSDRYTRRYQTIP